MIFNKGKKDNKKRINKYLKSAFGIALIALATSSVFAYPMHPERYKVIPANSSGGWTKQLYVDLRDGVYVTENPGVRYFSVLDYNGKVFNSIAPPVGSVNTMITENTGLTRDWRSLGGSVSGGWSNYANNVINLNSVDATATTPYVRLPKVAKAGHTFTGWSITQTQRAYYYYNGALRNKTGSSKITSSGGWYQTNVGAYSNVHTVRPNFTRNNYYLDVNGMLDGSSSGGTSGYGTFDVYINGGLVANDVSDYYASHPYGSSYSITDIRAKTGKQYNGVHSGSTSGTIDGTKSTYLNFSTSSYSNHIAHWAGGYKYGEGNNGSKNMKNIGNTSFNVKYDSSYSMNSSRAVSIPKGYYLSNTFGTSSISGGWGSYSMGTSVRQKATSMNYEYYYQPYNYSLTYDLAGGTMSGQPSNYTVLYSATLPNPTRKAYEFLGWTGSNGSTPQKNLTIPAGSIGNKSYKANWKLVEFNVTFNTMGGTAVPPVVVKINNTIPVPKPPTRNGYMFDGWYTSVDYNSKWNFNTRITNHITLYAKWIKNPEIIANNRYFLENENFTKEDLLKNITVNCEDQNYKLTVEGFSENMVGNIGDYNLTIKVTFPDRNTSFEKDFKLYITETPTEEYIRSINLDALYTLTSSSYLFDKLNLIEIGIGNNNPIRSFIVTKY